MILTLWIFQEHLVLGFAKLGGLDDALFVFNRLVRRTAFSWTAMITGSADYDQGYQAIDMYQCMLMEGVEPDRFTFISLFKACGIIGYLKQGKELHLEAQRMDLASNTFVSNTLISMYGKCGGVAEAEDVFYRITIRSVVSWTAMIAVYVENNQAEKEMEDVSNIDGEFIKTMSLDLGKALHVEAWRAGFSSDAYIVTTLVSMYGKCGAIAEAEATFSALAKHNVPSWTAMISVYVENSHGEKALLVYRQMQEEGASPNEHTLVCALQACDTLTGTDGLGGQGKKSRSWEIGQALHADAHTRGFASGEVLGNALVSMYGRYGVVKEAEHVFTGLRQRNVISWTAMLSAYVDQGKPERALQTYLQMYEEGTYPNRQTLVMALQACDTLAESNDASTLTQHQQSSASICLNICQSLHVDAERTGLASDVFVGSALLSIYANCGAFSQAKEVFYTLPQYDTGSWNAMLSAFVERDGGEMALHLYRCMLEEDMTLDNITFMNVLQACNKVCILQLCREVHFSIVSTANDFNLLLVSSLIHTYGSCSSMPDAETTLVGMPRPDAVSWNACIASYAEAGNCEASSQILEAMLLACMQPDGITFAAILSACNHGGLVEGTEYFESMRESYGLNPDFKHFAGVLDLLGRAGDFKRLENVLLRLPKQPDLAIWLSLLGSCYKHSNMELGRFALLNAVRLQSNIVLE
ncbi:hypothetical protein GOP47_0024396 [Adiantum capillus-veneris]|uniref:Pentatricopeptide repeat-containing protein n=1 Tax=Adiantum capillus-veneris TaxID=13818 RepID=A0A9D4U1N8_ADICA|nr:hypothetical protein GOP47_0024396 [Adiantum capillus-veneris]